MGLAGPRAAGQCHEQGILVVHIGHRQVVAFPGVLGRVGTPHVTPAAEVAPLDGIADAREVDRLVAPFLHRILEQLALVPGETVETGRTDDLSRRRCSVHSFATPIITSVTVTAESAIMTTSAMKTLRNPDSP